MAVVEGMFLFEVVVESIQSLIECKQFVIKSDFADIFSLELRDPKQLNIVMPEPLPIPPDPPGKKKKKPKPPKKGKKGKILPPPPEPIIQSGQSVLFACSAEFLIQNMRKCPIELSLWDKEQSMTYIGSNSIPWDETYLLYLTKIANCMDPPPVTVRDDYNVFEECTAKLVAKLGIQIKLSYLKDKVVAAFRTLSEDASIRKYLYTGLNSKTTSYICTLKTDDDTFAENSNKIKNNFVKDKKINYASFKNAPGTNLTFFNDGDYCCMNNADKPPESIYKSPETCPDINVILDYVRKTIVSCNDNMRMLTPQSIIRPRFKATDIDRKCYCTQTGWPDSSLAKRMKRDVQSGPCPLCVDAGKQREGTRGATVDIANLRGPCGRPDCRIARELRNYITTLVEEDNKEVLLSDIVGPCGSKNCTLAEKIQEFLCRGGVFSRGTTLQGLSTQCGCLSLMQKSLHERRLTCKPECDFDCMNVPPAEDESGKEDDMSADSPPAETAEPAEGEEAVAGDKHVQKRLTCGAPGCPASHKVYNVYYFTVEYFKDAKDPVAPNTKDNISNPSTAPSVTTEAPQPENKPSMYRFCDSTCPSTKPSGTISCSRSVCTSKTDEFKSENKVDFSKCHDVLCPDSLDKIPSPADSNIELNFNEIHNPCCVKTCDVAEKVKDFIAEGLESNKNRTAIDKKDPCYCDCVCNFHFTRKTTYCAICGGYEALGDDLKDQPLYAKPHPCPVYHKLYDKKYLKTKSPWSAENLEQEEKKEEKTPGKRIGRNVPKDSKKETATPLSETKQDKNKTDNEKKTKEKKKEQVDVPGDQNEEEPPEEKKPLSQKYTVPFVPKDMGWLWNAEDVPGMKFRPFWRPGASNKILVRKYRAMQGSIDLAAKKKRAMMQRRKKLEMKPTLVVKKIDGEYTVQMEVFKKYSKERLRFQYPYEERPPLIYTVGRTAEETEKRINKRERKERRETRRKCKLIQSTFRDKCQEICLKAYNQSIGVLPLPKANDPSCPCDTDAVYAPSPQIDSCSCSDEDDLESSDTDGDEWTIEFTPPAAVWDAKAKHPPVMADNESQYTYLDYKVKLLDKSGNPVPRYFKGPDGKQECSDLGGFWGPGHVWQEINKDGYIGVDNRWIPMNFIGPDGMFYSAEEGSFTDNNGQNLRLGIDGYIDKDLKWVFYPKHLRKSPSAATGGTKVDKKVGNKTKVPDAKPAAKDAKDNKDSKKAGTKETAKEAPHKGGKPSTPAKDNKPQKVSKAVSYSSNIKGKNPAVMSTSVIIQHKPYKPMYRTASPYYFDNIKKIAKYKEIMEDLEMYDSIAEIKSFNKTTRASNTLRKNFSPFTLI